MCHNKSFKQSFVNDLNFDKSNVLFLRIILKNEINDVNDEKNIETLNSKNIENQIDQNDEIINTKKTKKIQKFDEKMNFENKFQNQISKNFYDL